MQMCFNLFSILIKDFYIWVLKKHLYFGLKDMTTHQTLLPIQENTTDVALFDPYLQNNLTGICKFWFFKIRNGKDTLSFEV